MKCGSARKGHGNKYLFGNITFLWHSTGKTSHMIINDYVMMEAFSINWPLVCKIHQWVMDFHYKEPVMLSCDDFFVVCLNMLLRKLSIFRVIWDTMTVIWHHCSVLWHCGLNQMAAILQTTFWYAYILMQIFIFFFQIWQQFAPRDPVDNTARFGWSNCWGILIFTPPHFNELKSVIVEVNFIRCIDCGYTWCYVQQHVWFYPIFYVWSTTTAYDVITHFVLKIVTA